MEEVNIAECCSRNKNISIKEKLYYKRIRRDLGKMPPLLWNLDACIMSCFDLKCVKTDLGYIDELAVLLLSGGFIPRDITAPHSLVSLLTATLAPC